MSRTLAIRLSRLDSQRDDLLVELAPLTAAQLEYRPEPRAWSIAQVVAHLAATEEIAVEMGRADAGGSGRTGGGLEPTGGGRHGGETAGPHAGTTAGRHGGSESSRGREAPAAIGSPASTWRRRLRRWYRRTIVFGVLTFGVKVRMPRKVQEMVGEPAPESAAAALARWEAARASLRTYVATLGPADETRRLFYHPIAGWFDHREGLDFLRRHVRHHRRQIARIRKAGGF